MVLMNGTIEEQTATFVYKAWEMNNSGDFAFIIVAGFLAEILLSAGLLFLSKKMRKSDKHSTSQIIVISTIFLITLISFPLIGANLKFEEEVSYFNVDQEVDYTVYRTPHYDPDYYEVHPKDNPDKVLLFHKREDLGTIEAMKRGDKVEATCEEYSSDQMICTLSDFPPSIPDSAEKIRWVS